MKRVLSGGIVAALLLIPAASPVSAHTPEVDIGCRHGQPIVAVHATKYDAAGTNTVRVRIDGALRFERDFPSAFQSISDLGSPFVGHTVAVRVRAWDDPDGSLGYSRVFKLVAGPCKHRREPNPGRAALYGPFLDPMYYARFWAEDTCTFRWTRVDGGVTKVITRTVAAGRSQSTNLKHADGGTTQTIRGCGVSITKVTAPGGNYAAP